jgi:phage portal protein BeeE
MFPLRGSTVGQKEAFAQLVQGYPPQIYYTDEVAHSTYVPTSHQSHGMIPLEALVNKIAETMLFEELSASQADGTRPPDKLLLLHEQAPFGDLDKELEVPADSSEQEKTEQIINEAREGAVRVLSGMGSNTTEIDLTRKDTFQYYMQHEEQIRSDIALCFNMSNMEVNLTGAADTSGRATSESEMEIDQQRGLFPLVQTFMEKINAEVLPYRYGFGYELEFESGMSEAQHLNILQKKVQTQLWSKNELRAEEGYDPVEGEEYDKPPAPKTGDQQQEESGNDEANPLFVSEVQ